MKKTIFFTIIGALTFVSCSDFDFESSKAQLVKENAEDIFGIIDPRQNWNSAINGTITVTADAPLYNIEKVMILTASPFADNEANILAEAKVSKGETVTLNYDVPNTYTRLISACIDKDGHYYVKGFNVGEKQLSFKSSKARTRSVTRSSDLIGLEYIRLQYSNSTLSYNALRTIFVNDAYDSNDATLLDVVNRGGISQWYHSGWENDRLWKPTEKYNTGTEWEVRHQTIKHVLNNVLTENEVQSIKDELGDLLERSDNSETWGRKDHRKTVVNSDAVKFYNDELVSDGSTPITLAPIFMASSEIGSCHLYYYYYNPSNIPAGMSTEEYIKSLPKFKAIECWQTRKAANEMGYGANDIFRIHEFLLPYYGETLGNDQYATSLAIPKGYHIGFMLRKLKDTGVFIEGYRDVTDCGHGCCYGYGGLNREIHNLPSHFSSSKTEFSMNDDDPRVWIFNANGKTYLGFEDGSDCQYNDMIVEVGGYDKTVFEEAPEGAEEKSSGIETNYLYSEEEIEGQPYMLCFEDRSIEADYDMNDVVLRCRRQRGNPNRVDLSLVATGGTDDVYIMGIPGTCITKLGADLTSGEVHEFFGVENLTGEDRFVNTVKGGTQSDPTKAVYEIPAGMTIPQFLASIYIENRTTGDVIRVPKNGGEPPVAIIMPYDFEYPLEHERITNAYQTFLNWARNATACTNWFTNISENLVYPVEEIVK